ncbi:hypothetical protein [Cellulomonas sp. Marseille-Q8402]
MSTTARKSESDGTPISFEHQDQTLQVLAPSDWPVDALEAYEEGKVTTFLRAILTPSAWADFKSSEPKVVDLQGLVVAIQEAAGLSGN